MRLGNIAGEGQDQAEGVFCSGQHIGFGSIGHKDASLGGCV